MNRIVRSVVLGYRPERTILGGGGKKGKAHRVINSAVDKRRFLPLRILNGLQTRM